MAGGGLGGLKLSALVVARVVQVGGGASPADGGWRLGWLRACLLLACVGRCIVASPPPPKINAPVTSRKRPFPTPQAASPHIRAQWAWASVLNLTKMTSVKREAFPVSYEARRPCFLGLRVLGL